MIIFNDNVDLSNSSMKNLKLNSTFALNNNYNYSRNATTFWDKKIRIKKGE